MADQSEAIDPQRVGQSEQIGEQDFGGVIGHILRLVGRAEAAQVGHDHPKLVSKQRHECPPCAVRFGKAVK